MAARVITSIGAALDVLENKRRYEEMTKLDEMIAIMVHKLRALRTFVLCSRILEERPSSTLGSILEKIEKLAAKISNNQSNTHSLYTSKLRKYSIRLDSFEEELEQWYTSSFDCVLQSSSPAKPDQVWDIANSVVENLSDFLVIYDGPLLIVIKPLKENITFLRNFVRFATLLCADLQQFSHLLTLLCSAHVTVLLFSAIHYSAEDLFGDVSILCIEREVPYHGLMSKVVALWQQIETIKDPYLKWSYTEALESFKNSRESCVSKLDLKNFIAFLLSTVWEMLQLDTAPVVSSKDKLQVLYEGLGFLTIVLEKKLNESVGKIRDMTGLIAFDAGVVIFSLYETDFAIDHGLRDFVENIQLIRSEVLDVEQSSKFKFPKTTMLGFLEFLLDYLTEVRISSSHSDDVSIIQEHLVFLKSNMEKLLKLRNQQEELHQAVWSHAVEVAYKIELLIDHLVLGSVLDSFPASFQSIKEDMINIKEDFIKISDKGPPQSSNLATDDVVGLGTGRSSIINRLERGSMGLQGPSRISTPAAADDVSKLVLLVDHLELGSSFPASIQWIEEGMMNIKMDFMKISDEGPTQSSNPATDDVVGLGTERSSIIDRLERGSMGLQGPSRSSTPAANEVVGFETERSSIIDRLERGSKTLQVVAIVGMPGSGKTTLANMVYDDESVELHFHVRARCSVSQVFDIEKTMLELLKQTSPNAVVGSDVDDLCVQLWKTLKGKTYLILVDDIWEMQAFNRLKAFFPDDSNGSRILLTSRNSEVAPEAIADDDKPIYLRQLTESESLMLLQNKLFAGNDWPSTFGLEVAQYCKGLPLTIVIVAGILANTRQEAWKGVLESLRSDTITTLTDECIKSIELSYKHLPHHLKPCFLSFGAFPEDHSVSVKKLIWIWIAEGFVRKSESKRLEQVATDYLNILIGRSLVMKAKERSEGGVKECRMHDLLHDFCLRKASEESFLQVLSRKPLSFYELGNLRRLCIHSGAEHFKESKLFCPNLRSVSFFDAADEKKGHDMSFIFRISKQLRVLAMDKVGLTHLPSEIGFLVQLRYLAIHVGREVSSSIGNLTNLETLFLCPHNRRTKLPDTFWNLKKLRHLFTSHFPPDTGTIELPSNNLDSSCNLVDLDSLSALYSSTPDILEIQLSKFPNIRRLKFDIFHDPAPVLSFAFLSKLESLSLQYANLNATELKLPESMKKLSFLGGDLSANFFPTIAQLPNLEVLKVRHCNYSGKIWHVKEEEFSELKCLVLIGLKIVKWTTDSDDQFPNLEKLALVGCDQLVEIPECLGNVATLKMIDVGRWRPGRVASLVKKVKGVQKDYGNLVQARVRNIGIDFSEYVEISDDEEEKLGMDVSEDVEVSDKKVETSWWKKLRRRLLSC